MNEEEIFKEIEMAEDIYKLDARQFKAIVDLISLYEQEKEKNKVLEENFAKLTIHFIENHISKDKLKEKIEDYEKMIEGTFKDNTWDGLNRRDNCYEIIRVLNELLEDKQ